ATEDESLAERRTRERRERRQGGGARRPTGPTQDELDAQELRTIGAQQASGIRSARDNSVDVSAELNAERERRNQLDEEHADKQRELGAQMADAMRQEADKRNELVRLTRSQQEAERERISEALSFGNELGQVLSESFQMAISGQESFDKAFARGMKSILQQLGTKYVIEGIAALFQAIGYAFTAPPAAAGKAAEGIGLVTLGLSLGGIGAAIPSPSAAGAAGQPTGSRPSNDNARGGDTVIIYNAPVIDGRRSSDAEVGRGLEQYQRASERRYGT
ncbi:MAG: hypothetical protein ACOYLX_17365, partial [Burkholderiaceae bacterium]